MRDSIAVRLRRAFYFGLTLIFFVPALSWAGSSVGVLGLIHLYIEDLFPKSIGGPIFH